MVPMTFLVAGLLALAAPADPSGGLAPEVTLQFRLAPELGAEQPWRRTGPRLVLGAKMPYEFRALLDGEAFWESDVRLLHWEGASASTSDQGSVTAALMVPVAMDVEVGVAALTSGEGVMHTLTSFTHVEVVALGRPVPRFTPGKQAASAAPGGALGGDDDMEGARAGDVKLKDTGGCAGKIGQNTFAWLFDTGDVDAACTAGTVWAVTVMGPVRCKGGLDKVLLRDNFGLEWDYEDFVPPKPPIPTCTEDWFGIRLDIAEACGAGIEYWVGDVWKLEIQCCDGCTKTVTLIVQ